MRSSDYQLMLNEQQGRCAICQNLAKGKLVIDHDHSSGEVRGLLCPSCNLGLGHFFDNPSFLRRAIEYLQNDGHPSRFFIETARLIPLSQD